MQQEFKNTAQVLIEDIETLETQLLETKHRADDLAATLAFYRGSLAASQQEAQRLRGAMLRAVLEPKYAAEIIANALEAQS